MHLFVTAVHADLVKSYAANMLAAYYSKGADSKEMFSELEISKDEDFRKHLNKYDVIHMDIQWFLANCKDVNHIVEFITKNILDELKEIYPEILSDEVSYLPDALSRIKDKTGQKFIVIIDEWDVLIRDAVINRQGQGEYITFYEECSKGRNQQNIFNLHTLLVFFQSKRKKHNQL